MGQLRALKTSDKKHYKVTYRNKYLRLISSKNGKLKYNYNKKRDLVSVDLTIKGKKYKHKINKKNKAKSANQVISYLSDFYSSMGPLYKHSYVLREVIQ